MEILLCVFENKIKSMGHSTIFQAMRDPKLLNFSFIIIQKKEKLFCRIKKDI